RARYRGARSSHAVHVQSARRRVGLHAGSVRVVCVRRSHRAMGLSDRSDGVRHTADARALAETALRHRVRSIADGAALGQRSCTVKWMLAATIATTIGLAPLI